MRSGAGKVLISLGEMTGARPIAHSSSQSSIAPWITGLAGVGAPSIPLHLAERDAYFDQSHARSRARRGAFTLIEVVLAVTLSIMLIGAAMWFYRHAGDVRAELAAESNDISQRRQMLERITMDLRNAVALPSQSGSLSGTTDRVTFITASLPSASVWSEQKLTETPPPAEQDLRQVSYGLLYYEDDLGNREYVGIESQVQKLLSPKTAEVGKEIKATLLSTKYLFMRFQYWDGTAWQIEWVDKPTPPVAIEVAIGVEPMTEGGDPLQYEGPLIRRVIFLPAGAPTAEGSVIQGIGGAP